MKIVPVILSGGYGTRLWPLSRKQYPKQYLNLMGSNTMLQDAVLRLKGLPNLAPPIIVCNIEHRFLVAEQLQQININKSVILLEPVGRNTAPAILVAALQAITNYKSESIILLVLTADHIIENAKALHVAIETALDVAKNKKLITFGVVPIDANTGYGYIEINRSVNKHNWYKVKKFVEKPDKKTAIQYLSSGNYLWNSGMFMFRADVLVAELTLYAKAMVETVKKSLENASNDLDFIRLEPQAFELSPNDSIDYTLMEKSNNVVVVPLKTAWSDIGSWAALDSISAKDDNGNFTQGDVFIKGATNSYISAKHHLVAVIGVDNLVVVDTPNATLILNKKNSQEVGGVVKMLQQQKREEYLYHRKVYRPWGWYDSIETGDSFQVKKLHINPQAKLSLQKHYKRAEHWVVVKGVATVINGEQRLTLVKGQSTYIPVKTIHSLENKENTELEVIEVQSGTYLGEDDIVRFEDVYGRT